MAENDYGREESLHWYVKSRSGKVWDREEWDEGEEGAWWNSWKPSLHSWDSKEQIEDNL